MNTTKVTGWAALEALVSVSLGEKARIIEHNAGIDIDNAARPYDHERNEDYQHVLWNAMLYVTSVPTLQDGYTIDDLFSADVVQGEQFGNTDTKVLWFHINEDIFDGESRGTHFEFLYSTTQDVPVRDVRSGDEYRVGKFTVAQAIDYTWREVDAVWFEDDRTVSVALLTGDGEETQTRELREGLRPGTVVTVRRWA